MTRISILTTATAIALGAGPALADAQIDIDAIDVNGNGLVEYEEFAAAYPNTTRATFDAIDADASGTLEAAELARRDARLMIEGFGVAAGEARITADLDGNGRVTHDELSAVIPGFPVEVFAELDLNGNGALDLLEFNTGTAQAAIRSRESNVLYVHKDAVDLDGDGIVTDEELAQAIPGYQPGNLQPIEAVAPGRGDILTPVGHAVR